MQLDLITSDRTRCTKCLACIETCPMRVIVADEDGYPVPNRDAYKICINCGWCVDACAFDALHHRVRKRNASATAAALLRLRRQKARKMRRELDK